MRSSLPVSAQQVAQHFDVQPENGFSPLHVRDGGFEGAALLAGFDQVQTRSLAGVRFDA